MPDMESIPHYDSLRVAFLNLSQEDMEHFYCLSTFAPDHAQAAISNEIEVGDIEERITEYAKNLFTNPEWNKINDRKSEYTNYIIDKSFDGDLINHLLSWYIVRHADHLEGMQYSAKPESNSTRSEYDVVISDPQDKRCGIELKRCSTSHQLHEYMDEHINNLQKRPDVDTTMLIAYFPTSDSIQPKRISDLVRGYQYLSERFIPFFSQPENKILTVPTPLYRDSDSTPLEETWNEITKHHKIRKR